MKAILSEEKLMVERIRNILKYSKLLFKELVSLFWEVFFYVEFKTKKIICKRNGHVVFSFYEKSDLKYCKRCGKKIDSKDKVTYV